LPDLQGPLSVAELLWGPGIYLAFFDEPELVKALLGVITDLTLVVAKRLQSEVRDNLGQDLQYQHAVGVRGALLIRNDSAINISARQYIELVRPFDARLAAGLGSIGIHFCGNGAHQVQPMQSIPGVVCFDIGQPEMMDLDRLYAAAAAARRIALARLAVSEADLRAELVKRRFPTGVNLVYQASSVAKAYEVWGNYIHIGS
jgi:hypothetical protein